MKNFRTYGLALELYKECTKLKMPNYLKDHLNRASLSIVLNLAEASGKRTFKEKRRFYHISLGSLRETTAIIDILGHDALLKKCDILGAHIWKLTKNSGPKTPDP